MRPNGQLVNTLRVHVPLDFIFDGFNHGGGFGAMASYSFSVSILEMISILDILHLPFILFGIWTGGDFVRCELPVFPVMAT